MSDTPAPRISRPGLLRLGLLAASLLVSISGLLCYGWANDANGRTPGAAELIVLPGRPLTLAALAFA